MARVVISFGNYLSSSATTTSITPGTYKKASGTTSAGSLLNGFIHSNNRLTYTGAVTKRFKIHADGKVGGISGTVFIAIYKQGTDLIRSESTTPTTLALLVLTEGSWGLNCIVELAKDEYIELFITTSTGTSSTLRSASVVITEV